MLMVHAGARAPVEGEQDVRHSFAHLSALHTSLRAVSIGYLSARSQPLVLTVPQCARVSAHCSILSIHCGTAAGTTAYDLAAHDTRLRCLHCGTVERHCGTALHSVEQWQHQRSAAGIHSYLLLVCGPWVSQSPP
jgi:hypothetical protein